MKIHLRDGDLRGAVVVQAERAALQHLKAEALTLVSIYVHRHDCQRQLSCIFHLETFSDCKKRLVGAQT